MTHVHARTYTNFNIIFTAAVGIISNSNSAMQMHTKRTYIVIFIILENIKTKQMLQKFTIKTMLHFTTQMYNNYIIMMVGRTCELE